MLSWSPVWERTMSSSLPTNRKKLLTGLFTTVLLLHRVFVFTHRHKPSECLNIKLQMIGAGQRKRKRMFTAFSNFLLISKWFISEQYYLSWHHSLGPLGFLWWRPRCPAPCTGQTAQTGPAFGPCMFLSPYWVPRSLCLKGGWAVLYTTYHEGGMDCVLPSPNYT